MDSGLTKHVPNVVFCTPKRIIQLIFSNTLNMFGQALGLKAIIFNSVLYLFISIAKCVLMDKILVL